MKRYLIYDEYQKKYGESDTLKYAKEFVDIQQNYNNKGTMSILDSIKGKAYTILKSEPHPQKEMWLKIKTENHCRNCKYCNKYSEHHFFYCSKQGYITTMENCDLYKPNKITELLEKFKEVA